MKDSGPSYSKVTYANFPSENDPLPATPEPSRAGTLENSGTNQAPGVNKSRWALLKLLVPNACLKPLI